MKEQEATMRRDEQLPTGVGFQTSGSVSSADLHTRTKDAIDRVRDGESLAVTHYNQVEAYLMPRAMVESIAARAASVDTRERELRETLPLVIAAARAGVAIPSETLNRITPGLDASWRAVAVFASSYPLHLSAGEDGEPLTRGRLRAAAGPILESGDDDELDLDA